MVMSVKESVQLPVVTKKKSNKDYSCITRVYDTDGYRLRADAVCFRDEGKQEVSTSYMCTVDTGFRWVALPCPRLHFNVKATWSHWGEGVEGKRSLSLHAYHMKALLHTAIDFSGT